MSNGQILAWHQSSYQTIAEKANKHISQHVLTLFCFSLKLLLDSATIPSQSYSKRKHYLFWDVTQGEYKGTWFLNPPYLRSKAYPSQHANLCPFVWLKPATVCHIILFDVLGLIGTISRALNVYFIATLNVIFSPSSVWKGRSLASSEQSCEARHISITSLLQTMSRHKRKRLKSFKRGSILLCVFDLLFNRTVAIRVRVTPMSS